MAQNMEIDLSLSKDSCHPPPLNSPEGSVYYSVNDLLVYDKYRSLVGNQKAIRYYDIAKPIGYALLVGSDRNLYPEEDGLSGKAIHTDLKLMSTVLKGCDWTVHSPCYSDKTTDVTLTKNQCNQVLTNLENMSAELKQFSCFLFYYSGHGVSDSVILSDEELMLYKEIVTRVSRIPSLEPKPKIFIFDCCRGPSDFEKHERHEFGNVGSFQTHIQHKYEQDKQPEGYPPTDTVICFSAAEGMKSLMEKDGGSVFTLQLAHALLQFGSRLSFCELITQINGGTVCIARQAFNRIQQPVVIHTLTRLLVLNTWALANTPKDVVCGESAHSEPREPRNWGEPEVQQKGPYFTHQKTQDSDVVKDEVTGRGRELTRKRFTSQRDIESHLSQLGEGMSVFLVYAPDPESPYNDPRSRGAEINQNEHLIYGLAYDLERHGFHVVTDLHLGDTQPSNWLQWYTSRISLCDFVLLVCSPAFNEIFSHGQRRPILDDRTKLLLSYKDAVYAEILSEVQRGGKFVPVMLHPYWSVDDCVPTMFRAGTVYQVVDQPPRKFVYSDKTRDFEKLVCRMAGINRMELDKPQVVGVHQLGGPYRGDAAIDDRRSLAAMKKRRVGHKLVKPGDIPSSSGYSSSSSGFGGGAPGYIPPAAVPQVGQPPVTTAGYTFQQHFYGQQPLPPHPPVGPHHPQQLPFSHIGYSQPLPTVPQHPTAPGLAPAAPMVPVPPQQPSTATPLPPDPNALPDKEPDVSVLLWLSWELRGWKFIGRFLGITENEIERIEAENPGNISEQCYKMLDTWRRQLPSKYSYRTLGEVLLKSEKNKELYRDYAKKVTETE